MPHPVQSPQPLLLQKGLEDTFFKLHKAVKGYIWYCCVCLLPEYEVSVLTGIDNYMT